MTGVGAQRFLVYGPWQLRFNEPLPPAAELHLAECNSPFHGEFSAIVDLRVPDRMVPGVEQGAVGDSQAALFPLALARRSGGDVVVTHLLSRFEKGFYQFFRPPIHQAVDGTLMQQVAALFEANHLKLNNYECFYPLRPAVMPAGTTFVLSGDVGPSISALLDSLRTARLLPLALQFGNELQHWDYDFGVELECADNLKVNVMANVCRDRTKKALANRVSLFEVCEGGPQEEPWLGAVRTLERENAMPTVTHNRQATVISCESLDSGQIYQAVFSRVRALGSEAIGRWTLTVRRGHGHVEPSPGVGGEEVLVRRRICGAASVTTEPLSQREATLQLLNSHGSWA